MTCCEPVRPSVDGRGGGFPASSNEARGDASWGGDFAGWLDFEDFDIFDEFGDDIEISRDEGYSLAFRCPISESCQAGAGSDKRGWLRWRDRTIRECLPHAARRRFRRIGTGAGREVPDRQRAQERFAATAWHMTRCATRRRLTAALFEPGTTDTLDALVADLRDRCSKCAAFCGTSSSPRRRRSVMTRSHDEEALLSQFIGSGSARHAPRPKPRPVPPELRAGARGERWSVPPGRGVQGVGVDGIGEERGR